MHILFDHQIFSSQQYGGVSKYFAEVISRLPQESCEVTAWLSNNEYAKYHQLFKQTPFFPSFQFRGKGRIMSEIGKPYSIYKILKGNFDIIHQTNFDTYLTRFMDKKPMVTTYHDVNFVTQHDYNSRMLSLQKKSLQRASAIIAVSENTKRDILKYFEIDEAKITVIHHGVSRPDIPVGLSARVFNRPYILYVGNRHAFKNFKNFIKAFGMVASKFPEIDVMCTRGGFNEEEWKLFRSLHIENRVHVVQADEVTLNLLYRDALFFIFPSLYEGFGMPILEAMINHCPVALANASCFPEIAGDAGVYFDPTDLDSIANVIENMINSETLRKQFSIKGYQHAQKFTWQKSADLHYQLYKSLLS